MTDVLQEIKKLRQPIEWTALIIKYITAEEITATDKLFVEKILANCESESKKDGSTDKEKMWKQLNKYWLYLSTLQKKTK